MISERLLYGLLSASDKTKRPIGDLLTDAIETFIAPINAKPITLEPGDVVLTLDGIIREIGKALSVAIAWRNEVAVGQPTKAA